MRHKVMLAISLFALVIFAGVGCERKIVNEDAAESQAALNSCFTCHGEDGFILAAQGEWQNSVHASGTSVDYTNREGRDCTKCHDHQGFVDFLETGELNGPFDNVSAIHCFTCHAPHTRGNLSLRVDDPYTLINNVTFDLGSANLCANCHHANTSVNTIAANMQVYDRWGPHHGPQSDLLIATGGYEYDDLEYDYENTGHGAEEGDDGCIKCHMGNPEAHNGYAMGGHSFNMVNPDDEEEILVGVCQECHTAAEDFDYEGIQTDVEEMLEELGNLLVLAGHLDEESGLPEGTSQAKHTIADEGEAGALWNYLMIEEDRSHGVHNPFYIRDLLESSIEYMESRVPTGASGLASTLSPIPAH